jgi:N-acetylmuramoyl-L-alanine amidase
MTRHFFCMLAAGALITAGGGGRARAADAEVYGTTYRALPDVAAQTGLKLAWTVPAKTMQLKGKYSTLDFTVNERQMVMNGSPVAFGSPIVLYRGGLWIAKRDYDKNVVPLLAPRTLPNPPALHRIVIDPGHGGKDPGGENPAIHVSEKNTVLDVALKLQGILQKAGYQVALTRSDDRFIERTERPAIANRYNADLFISIHFNIAPDADVNGIETYVLTPPWQPSSSRADLSAADKQVDPGNKFDLWNVVAGYAVQSQVAKDLKANDRGLKRARWDVLTDLQMPGMLIEGGFLTNMAEGRKIGTADYRLQLAQGIADGIALYASTLQKARTAQAPAGPPPKTPAAAGH